VSSSRDKKPQFGKKVTFFGLLYPAPSPMRAKFGVLEHTHGIRLRAKFRLDWFILSPSGVEKSQILPFFGLRHFVVSPVGGSLTKLYTGAQLQTFPYPMLSNSFLYSNAFMAKSGAQSLAFKSVTDKRTDKTRNGKHRRAAVKPTACTDSLCGPNLACNTS